MNVSEGRMTGDVLVLRCHRVPPWRSFKESAGVWFHTCMQRYKKKNVSYVNFHQKLLFSF